MARLGVSGILEEFGKLLVVLEDLLEPEEVSVDSLTVRSFGGVLEMTGDGLSEELDSFGILGSEKKGGGISSSERARGRTERETRRDSRSLPLEACSRSSPWPPDSKIG